MLDELSATTVVIMGLLFPIILVAILYFLTPNFFRRFRIIILVIALVMEAFLIMQVGPLFL